jgi:2-oxoacid:acceptor oxidoreductase gamma subunit (pyruvate/2-ketoisovalerate family)
LTKRAVEVDFRMMEIIFYGRGGQGAVTASQILATAAFSEGKYSQAFPYFGSERKGAAVMAYVRISETPIEIRNPIEQPDTAVVLDSGLFKTLNPLLHLKKRGIAVINISRMNEEVIIQSGKSEIEIYTIDATDLSEKIYGPSSLPKTNVAMLGALSACGRIIKLESITATLPLFFKGKDTVRAAKMVKLAHGATRKIHE